MASFVHELRKLRNYIHSGVIAPLNKPVKFTKGVFNVVFEIFDMANSWIIHRAEQNLVKRMEQEARNSTH